MKKLVYVLLCVFVLAGCSDSGVTPPAPTQPNIAGAWSGTGTRGDDNRAFTITMTVTENGPGISATATFAGALIADNVSLTGSMNGTTLTLSGPGGNVQLSGVVAGTTLSGNGSALLQSGATLPFTFALSQTAGDPTNPTNPPPSDPTNPTPPAPTPPTDDGTCANTWNRDVTVPTTLTNTASVCDYLLEGFVEISSTLTIEPGVVVRASQDASLWVDGGQILAVGTPEARITLEGLNHIAGYWDGIRVVEGRESQFDYVDLKDAGQVCSVQWCPDAGLILDDITVSFTNSSVSNSYVHGFHATGDVLFTRFENNRFYNNTWAGVVIDGNYAPMLDVASDYSGGAEPNGTPFVLIANGSQTAGKEFRWKKLSAPYLIGGYFNVEGGTLVLEPGVEMVFGSEAWMWVEGNGVLSAVGTAAEPIIFRGSQPEPGHWDGLTFDDSPWESNKLEYVEIRHSGNTEGIVSAYAAVRLEYAGRVEISNSVIADNAKYGIACDEQSEYVGSPVLTLGPGNTFSNNASGDIDPACNDAMTP